jgi:hypothetical protein
VAREQANEGWARCELLVGRVAVQGVLHHFWLKRITGVLWDSRS